MNNDAIKLEIQKEIEIMMNRVLENVLIKNPFIVEEHHAAKPLYAALVPDEIFKGSHFEHRFVTPFGKIWERLAAVVARQNFDQVSLGETIDSLVPQERLYRISEVLNALEHKSQNTKRIPPNWSEELAYILAGKGELIPVKVTCDLICRQTAKNQAIAMEIKTPLPNSDQTKVSKEKMLKLYSMEPLKINDAYFALPYNPYGQKSNYAWSFPKRWFQMESDPVVLIGDEFWDLLGGTGTYAALVAAVNEIGDVYKEQIYRDFLGIDPPSQGMNFRI